MTYMGSKRRIINSIMPIMLMEVRDKNLNAWIEPFVGGGNVIEHVPVNLKRTGYDINPHTISALIDIRDDAQCLPDCITKDEYSQFMHRPAEKVTSWVRIACSFGGKFQAGLASGSGRNYVAEAKRNAINQSSKIRGVDLKVSSFIDIPEDTEQSLIYCDPPYQGTTGYGNDFNHAEFFSWCRFMSEKNSVFVSEYSAPDDFFQVWGGEIKTNFSSTRKSATHNATEKLFIVGKFIK